MMIDLVALILSYLSLGYAGAIYYAIKNLWDEGHISDRTWFKFLMVIFWPVMFPVVIVYEFARWVKESS